VRAPRVRAAATALATAAAIALASAGAAGAATVSQHSRLERGECAASHSCRTLVTTALQARPGERNRIEIVDDRRSGATGTTETLRLRDRGRAPLVAGDGCSPQADGSVVCTLEANPPVGASPDAPAPPEGTEQVGILRVHLGDGADTLRVADAAGHRLASPGTRTVFDGGPGDDRIDACATMRGGPGNDHLEGGPGGDTLEGGPGDDRLAGGAGEDLLNGGPGADVLRGGALSDDLRGGRGPDRLLGGPGFDDLRGDAGDDRLDGGGSPDHLYGGTGDDRLWGGRDHRSDDLHGGPGLDRARRGPGADTYRQIERFT
jgi:Ca2+-binding RTX toxin-like protein